MNNLNDLLTTQQFAQESIATIFLNLLLCMVLVILVGWFYKKYSKSLGGKSHVGSILPLIGLTVFMVITVVKSSLALSLGLVGALSIVRFRTPIKEPEELGYLFLTIAIGLGFGAGFQIITIAITSVILLYLYLTSNKSSNAKIDGEYTLILTLPGERTDDVEKILDNSFESYKLIRMETDNDEIIAYYNVSCNRDMELKLLVNNLKQNDPSIRFNLIESGVNW